MSTEEPVRTAHIIPHGWTRGQPLRQHGGGRVERADRYRGTGPFPRRHSIALCQDLGWPPRIVDVAPDTVYAVAFHDADDVNQWLDWWFDYKPETVDE